MDEVSLGSKVAKRQDIVANFNRAFKDRWRHLVNGFWFVPFLISLLGPLLALFFLALDNAVGQVDRTFLFSGGTAEASVILSTIAGSLQLELEEYQVYLAELKSKIAAQLC